MFGKESHNTMWPLYCLHNQFPSLFFLPPHPLNHPIIHVSPIPSFLYSSEQYWGDCFNQCYILVIVMGNGEGDLNSFDGFSSLSFYDLCLMDNTDSETTSWQKQLTVFFCCCTYNIYTSLREQCLFINSLFARVQPHLSALDLRQLSGCGQLAAHPIWTSRPLVPYSRITVCHIVRIQHCNIRAPFHTLPVPTDPDYQPASHRFYTVWCHAGWTNSFYGYVIIQYVPNPNACLPKVCCSQHLKCSSRSQFALNLFVRRGVVTKFGQFDEMLDARYVSRLGQCMNDAHICPTS